LNKTADQAHRQVGTLAAKRAARAIDALRRGWAVTVQGPKAAITLRAVETNADISAHALLISASRAATLKLVNQRAAGDTSLPVMIAAPADMTPSLAVAIADPTLDLLYPLKGPFAALPLPDEDAASAAMELARHAGLMPAFLVSDDEEEDSDIVTPADVQAFADSNNLMIATRARLPVSASETAEIVAFRSVADSTDHVALIVGKRNASVPVVRLHRRWVQFGTAPSVISPSKPRRPYGSSSIMRIPASWQIARISCRRGAS
jgi:GTP cyclohydrolase II